MNHLAAAIERVVHPGYNQALAAIICLVLPLCTGAFIYLGTGSQTLAGAAGAFSFMIGMMLEAILVVLKQILEHLPKQ